MLKRINEEQVKTRVPEGLISQDVRREKRVYCCEVPTTHVFT